MATSGKHHRLHYVEFTAPDLGAVKAFYGAAFGWKFVDYSPTYTTFTSESAGLDGGFEQGEGNARGALVILSSDDLGPSERAVVAAGGTISTPAFDFPGGRRFHFPDVGGNELAAWAPAEA